MDILKPCPFCDGTSEVYEVDSNGIIKYSVRCTNCKTSLPNIYTLRDFAIMKWNQRGLEYKREDD